MKPPPFIDGAKVLEWAWSAPTPFFVMEYDDQEGGIPIHGLAICRYERTGNYYKFSCNENWETENDSPQGSVESAHAQRTTDYDTSKVKWTKWTEPEATS